VTHKTGNQPDPEGFFVCDRCNKLHSDGMMSGVSDDTQLVCGNCITESERDGLMKLQHLGLIPVGEPVHIPDDVYRDSIPDHSEIEIPRRIVAAASRAPCGFLAVGARHNDSVMVAQEEFYVGQTGMSRKNLFREQGFIDQKGIFLTREEAWPIALKARQILRRVGGDNANGGRLYSENLY